MTTRKQTRIPRTYWFSKEVAATWPEGSAVLMRMKRNGCMDHYEATGWHRPDWLMGDDRDRYVGCDVQFALLALPKTGTTKRRKAK